MITTPVYGPANVQVARFLKTFEDFPRAKSLDFNIDDMVEALNPARAR